MENPLFKKVLVVGYSFMVISFKFAFVFIVLPSEKCEWNVSGLKRAFCGCLWTAGRLASQLTSCRCRLSINVQSKRSIVCFLCSEFGHCYFIVQYLHKTFDFVRRHRCFSKLNMALLNKIFSRFKWKFSLQTMTASENSNRSQLYVNTCADWRVLLFLFHYGSLLVSKMPIKWAYCLALFIRVCELVCRVDFMFGHIRD